MSPSAAAGAWAGRRRETACYVALGILVLGVSALQALWLAQDSTPMRWGDASAYATKTLEFVDGLDDPSLSWWERIASLSRDGRPPLYQLASAAFVPLFGRSMDSLLAINIVYGALLLLATFGIARVVAGGGAGLLAALLVFGYPPVILLSRMYMPHFGLIAWTAATLWMLLLCLERRSVVAAWLLGVSMSAGILTSHYYVFHAPVVVLPAGLYLLLFQRPPRLPRGARDLVPWMGSKLRDRFVAAGLLPAAVLAGGSAALWYLTEGRALLEVISRVARYSEIRGSSFVDTSMGFRDVDASFFWYALTAPRALSWPLALLAALGLVVALRKSAAGVWLALSVLVSYALLGSSYSPGWYRFAAQLPALAALSAALLFRLRPAWLKWSAVAVFAGIAALNHGYVSWGSPETPTGRVAAALGSPVDPNGRCDETYFSMAYCPWPPQAENWRLEEMVELVVSDPGCADRPCRVAVLPSQLVRPAHLQFVGVRDWPSTPIRWRTLGGPWWERSTTGRLFQYHDDYLVYRLKRRDRAVPQRIAAALRPAGPYILAAELPLPDGFSMWVLRRADVQTPTD